MMAICHFLALAKSKPCLVKLGRIALFSFDSNLYILKISIKIKKIPCERDY